MRLTEHVWLRAADMLLPAFQGFESRKNKFPVGEGIVMLFVPLLVLIW